VVVLRDGERDRRRWRVVVDFDFVVDVAGVEDSEHTTDEESAQLARK
jgi:hypothetical protein